MGVSGANTSGAKTSGAPENVGRDTVYFVSDAHFGLGENEDERVRLFRELAAEMRERAAALYIVGDLFDFWVEYRRAIRPDYFLALHELRSLVEASVDVHYLVGNHDFAIGPFLENTVGMRVHKACIDVTLQDRKIHISHGDKIGKNAALRIIDLFLRNNFCQTLYRMIHPDIGVQIGEFFSAKSKKRTGKRKMSETDLEKYRRAARAHLKNGKHRRRDRHDRRDLVIFAHTHHAELIDFGNGEYCNTGSWKNTYDYAILRGGKIQLLKWGASAS